MTDRDKVVVESSLVLLSHPTAVKKLNGAASEAKATLTGISDAAGQSVWKAGDPQAVLAEETVAFTTYTLEFSGPVRIANFHDAVMGKGGADLQYSIMHFRRPGDPIGRDYRVIQQREDSGSAVAAPSEASTEAAEAPEAPSEATETPLPSQPKHETKPIPYGKLTVTPITDVNQFKDIDPIDPSKEETIKIQSVGNGPEEYYADFGIMDKSYGIKAFRVRGPDREGVKEKLIEEYKRQFDIIYGSQK